MVLWREYWVHRAVSESVCGIYKCDMFSASRLQRLIINTGEKEIAHDRFEASVTVGRKF